MNNTYFIGKHINYNIGVIKGTCCVCGEQNIIGDPIKKVLSSNFTDTDILKPGDIVCIYCSACIGFLKKNTETLRCTSFICTKENLIKLKREDCYKYIIHPPDPPFAFGVTRSYKKHIAYKTIINYEKDIFYIRTDNYTVKIKRKEDAKLLKIISKWYTRKSKTQTYFTKNEIMNGCMNIKKIKDYGDNYFQENYYIMPYRKTHLLEFYVFILNIKEEEKNDKN